MSKKYDNINEPDGIEGKSKLKEFFSKHKYEIIAGCALIVTGTIIVFSKTYAKNGLPDVVEPINTDAIADKNIITNSTRAYSPYEIPFNVSGHFRRLAENHRISDSKLEEVAKTGIVIPQGFTYVNPYVKGKCPA